MSSQVKTELVKRKEVVRCYLSDRRLEFANLVFEDVCFRGRALMVFDNSRTAGIFSPHGGPVECTATYEWTEKVRV